MSEDKQRVADRLVWIREYVEWCDERGLPAGACISCGEPWSMHPLWCEEYPADDDEPAVKLAIGILALAVVSALVSPGARTGEVLAAMGSPASFAEETETRIARARLDVASSSPDPAARELALRAAIAEGEIRPCPSAAGAPKEPQAT